MVPRVLRQYSILNLPGLHVCKRSFLNSQVCFRPIKMSHSTGSAISLDTPAQRPSKDISLEGKHVSIVGLKYSHAPDIFGAMGGSKNASLFNFLWQGPFQHKEEVVELFSKLQQSNDPVWYAIISNKTSKAIGYCSLMRIEPQHRVIEVGSISYSPLLQRTVCLPSIKWTLFETNSD